MTSPDDSPSPTWVTDYAADTLGWEPWQHDYKFGVFLIYPPDPLRALVNSLRTLHDPKSQSACDAHISLTIPIPGPVSESAWRKQAEAMRGFEPFEICHGAPTSYPGIPGVVLKVEPFETLARLVTKLEESEMFIGANPRRYPYAPHITIAEFISSEETEALKASLAAHDFGAGRFVCDTVAYAVPDNEMHFSERRALSLGGGS